jgi:hypothetical protein
MKRILLVTLIALGVLAIALPAGAGDNRYQQETNVLGGRTYQAYQLVTTVEIRTFTRTCLVDTLTLTATSDSLRYAYIVQPFSTRGVCASAVVLTAPISTGAFTVTRAAADSATFDRYSVTVVPVW